MTYRDFSSCLKWTHPEEKNVPAFGYVLFCTFYKADVRAPNYSKADARALDVGSKMKILDPILS